MSVDIASLSEGTLATNMLEMPQTQLIQANWAEHKQVNKQRKKYQGNLFMPQVSERKKESIENISEYQDFKSLKITHTYTRTH